MQCFALYTHWWQSFSILVFKIVFPILIQKKKDCCNGNSSPSLKYCRDRAPSSRRDKKRMGNNKLSHLYKTLVRGVSLMYFLDLTLFNVFFRPHPLCLKQAEAKCLPRSGSDVKQSGAKPNWILNSLCPRVNPFVQFQIYSKHLDQITVLGRASSLSKSERSLLHQSKCFSQNQPDPQACYFFT